MTNITGLHHVTVIAGVAQQNLDFYSGVMGMRLVKKSVNQDVPDTYHLFFADGEGHAGTDLTFFPWPELPEGRRGAGLTNEVGLAVRPAGLAYWGDRLAVYRVVALAETRFGESVLSFQDPHGVSIALFGTSDEREFTPWRESPVPVEYQVRGLHGVRMTERDLQPTADFLTRTLGFESVAEEAGWHRFVLGAGGSGKFVDIQELPAAPRGTWGVGSVHHIAWRVPDEKTQVEVLARVHSAGRRPTGVIDRFWFKSVYFREPGGALFEVATDGPGFTIDESPDHLGEVLILPPWLEPEREQIEAALPKLRSPATSGRFAGGSKNQ